MRYYSLTAKSGCGTIHAGDRVCNSMKPLTIGQLPSSDIRLLCDDDMLPQSICIIRRDSDGGGWILAKQSDFYSVRVNDTPVPYSCRLGDGDIIRIGELSLVFRIHSDGRYSESQGILRARAGLNAVQMAILCISLVAVLAVSIVYPVFREKRSVFSADEDRMIRSSIYKLSVCGIMLQVHTPADREGEYRIVDSYCPESVSSGTCFFTTDGLCVTARHCVEPWLDYSAWDDDIILTNLPQDVYWAVISERSRLEQSDTLYRIVSECRVTDGDSLICGFTSDMCSFNRTRDNIVHLGSDLLPWRIIYPLYTRRDVELGDFAFVQTERKGSLVLATDEYLSGLRETDESEIRVYGFPRKNHGNRCEFQVASLAHRENDFREECLQLNVSGTSGYSGSPVIEKKDGKMTVIGIFSKIDDYDDSRHTFYAVPATEVSQFKPEESYEKDTFRR